MPVFRALLFLFGAVIVGLTTLYFVRADREYLRWAGRVFAAALVLAVLFFAVLLAQRLL